LAHEDGTAGSETGPEPLQVSNTAAQAASQAVAEDYGIAIRRTGQSVEITITSRNEYASIELYDSLVQSLGKGFLRLELNLHQS